ncbi:hypothetical protein [Burkholderia cenocepacia]|uniref:Uncharacterized protein n=1 Tax=Burkholderia phage Magia TaxID=2767577 RepID=A0A873WTY0_9CAUD|nr:hypothetical protein [Burkholderia cenocepacia]YP_010668148.1 hypothetical protein PQC04_gp52 [Burkholderia phage Magia]MBJ9897381.1 hypothetical protein [Burkholderia cenocepacia]MBJ9913954.1 hypothetical protein [Burkholderia cenocepacia]QPB08734.1 hypothetical protein CPT_Magia_052 [Burkholderia phage Magia]
MTPIDFLCSALDRLYERHPVRAIALMIVVAFVCMLAIAALNQDGTSVVSNPVRTA